MSKNSTPWIQTVTLTPPSLKDNTADADRLIQALKSRLDTPVIDIDLDLLKILPAVLRHSRFNIRCILFKEKQHWVLTGITDAKDATLIAGLAIDLGTTRVVLRLLDLATGRTLAESAFDNPQEVIGPDILARIHFAEKENGLKKLNKLIISGLNNVDVGTNAEVVLGNENWLIACAGAAGPALESSVTRMGMTAGPGVIDRIAVEPDTLEFNTHIIDDLPPKGICGSGVIDLAARLFLTGMIDIQGNLVAAVCGPKIKEIDGLLHLVVVPAEKTATGFDLTISQADLDSLIRSKAAMYTILETLTDSVGITPQDLESFFVAGTFGAFINPESAISIGMLPDLPLDRYKPLGNSSLGGATLALQSDKYHPEIGQIRDRITYMELNVNQNFMNRFSAAKFLPHTNTSLFPSVKLWDKRKQ
ncbi:MAG: DUF4445 domain-containing protein [Desulfobacterales bacterium]|nr:DUF4445 domain-containing protein [Desulfobacterales bacterium]